jgi:hypothetical protein
MDDFAAVNEVYAKFFPDPKPVSILFPVRYTIASVDQISGPHLCRCENATA